MDIKEYIASGIIENYVFNAVTDQERREVECMSTIYPEIKADLVKYQTAIENLALKIASPTPAAVKAKVMAAIATTKQDEPLGHSVKSENTPIIPFNAKSQEISKTGGPLKFLTAACILALIGIGAYTFSLKGNLNSANQELAETNSKLKDVNGILSIQEEANTNLNNSLGELNNQMAFLLDENTTRIELLGTPAFNDNIATVFWNTESKATYLDVINLNPASADESYQLWVLVEGVPKDMGVFKGIENTDTLIKMEQTDFADAFAITLEPLGGSESPTLDNLMVIGSI